MRNLHTAIAAAILVSSQGAFAADATKELSWSSVHLEGAHLQLVSPKEKDQSSDLYFGKGGNLSITSCHQGTCTGPLTVWKIEDNRLKTGYAPSKGDTLIKATANQITLRDESGKISVYEIKSRD